MIWANQSLRFRGTSSVNRITYDSLGLPLLLLVMALLAIISLIVANVAEAPTTYFVSGEYIAPMINALHNRVLISLFILVLAVLLTKSGFYNNTKRATQKAYESLSLRYPKGISLMILAVKNIAVTALLGFIIYKYYIIWNQQKFYYPPDRRGYSIEGPTRTEQPAEGVIMKNI